MYKILYSCGGFFVLFEVYDGVTIWVVSTDQVSYAEVVAYEEVNTQL